MTRREVLERYKKGVLYHTREATLSATQDEVMQDEALTSLAQIEESERLTEDDIYEILITQLPMRAYLSIPHPKLKEIATSIYQAQEKKGKRK